METLAGYNQSLIDDKREEFLNEQDFDLLVYILQEDSINRTKDEVIEKILDRSADIKEWGQDYWVRR